MTRGYKEMLFKPSLTRSLPAGNEHGGGVPIPCPMDGLVRSKWGRVSLVQEVTWKRGVSPQCGSNWVDYKQHAEGTPAQRTAGHLR
jgi:hypothetical protein